MRARKSALGTRPDMRTSISWPAIRMTDGCAAVCASAPVLASAVSAITHAAVTMRTWRRIALSVNRASRCGSRRSGPVGRALPAVPPLGHDQRADPRAEPVTEGAPRVAQREPVDVGELGVVANLVDAPQERELPVPVRPVDHGQR